MKSRFFQSGKKKYFFLLVILNLFQHPNAAQVNIVPNWSFEIVDTCQFYDSSNCLGGIYFQVAPPWDSPNTSSSDLFNTCSYHYQCDVPINGFGFQNPRTGNGYAGGYFYQTFSSGREMFQAPLDSILIAQHKYCVNFYINSSSITTIASNNFGMYFSSVHIDTALSPLSYLTPQINGTSIVSDTANWSLISGEYIAQGGEQFIIIGNFYSNAATDTMQIAGTSVGGSYYYLDDVSVIDCTFIGIEEQTINNFTITPNPTTGIFTINTDKQKIKEIKIFDVIGKQILSQKTNNTFTTIDITNLSQGIYFIETTTEQGTIRKKITKIN